MVSDLYEDVGFEIMVYRDVVEICFGGNGGRFTISAAEACLAELITTSSAALAEMRAGDAADA